MLTTPQKAKILSRTGTAIPCLPVRTLTGPCGTNQASNELQDTVRVDCADHAAAVRKWEQEIETLYVGYVATRAARSLRESEEAEQMHRLRAANARDSYDRNPFRADAR